MLKPIEIFTQTDLDTLNAIPNKGSPLRYFAQLTCKDSSHRLLQAQNKLCLLYINNISIPFTIKYLVSIGQTFKANQPILQIISKESSTPTDFSLPVKGTVFDMGSRDGDGYSLIFLPAALSSIEMNYEEMVSAADA